MAVSQEQKVDFLLKKIGFTASKTGNATDATGLSGTLTPKAGFAEAIPSPLIIANTALWNESGSIPATPPGSDTTQVKVYAPASALRMTVDSTVANNRAFIAYTTYNNTSSARLTNWIDTQFGADYIIQVFYDDATNNAKKLNAGGSGNNDGWFFDYSAGVLNFNDTNVPTPVTSTNVYIVGYRYVGQTGAPTSGISTFSYLDLTVERNLDVGIQGGISTFRNNIDLNADLDVDGHTNLDNVNITGISTIFDLDVDGHTELDRMRVTGVATFTNFIEAGSTGSGGIKVGSNLFIQDQANVLIQNTGNGSLYIKSLGTSLRDRNNNTIINASEASGARLYHTGGSTRKLGTTATGINLPEDLDVDGHTNLDNVSVAGVSTFTGDATFSGSVSIGGTLTYEDVTNVDSVGLLTARSGIRVTGGVIEALAGENKIPSLYANYSDLPSAGSYHGMFAHVHATGRGYFAHAGNWLELVNADTTGRVGTGTESYFIDRLVSTSTTATSLNVTGVTTAVTVDINGDLDVDGHTNLDNVSVGGAATITAPDNAMPFKIAASKGGGGIGTYLFTNSVGRFDFKFENTYNGNWYTGSTFHTRILWAAPNETGTTPEVCSIFPNTANAGAGGALHALEFSVTDNTSGLKKAYDMQHNKHAFYLNGNAVGLEINSTLGVGVTSYIYHGYTGGVGDTNTRFGFSQNEHIVFDTDGTQRFRIQNDYSIFSNNLFASADLDVDGHTNLDNVSIAGITTMGGNLTISGGTPTINFVDNDANPDYEIRNLNGYFAIRDTTSNTNKFRVNPDGHADIVAHLDCEDGLDVTGNITATGEIRIENNSPLIRFIDSNNNPDYWIQNNNGGLRIRDITNAADRFTVHSDGHVDINGDLDCLSGVDISNDLDVDGHTNLDNVSIAGVTTFAGNIDANGNLDVDGQTDLDVLNVAEAATFSALAEFDSNAKFDSTITAGGGTGTNGQYLKTTGSGVEWATFPSLRTRQTFTASAGQTTFSFNYTVTLLDVFVNGIKLTDAEFTATNGTSVVLSVGCFVGDIVELVSYNTVSAGGGASGIGNLVEDTTPQLGGNLDLFSKTINGTGGISITGVVTATTFIGDGSGLTGIVASGSGVVVKHDGSTVGTAGTINFGSNLDVTPISSGIVTVTAAAGGGSTAEVRANTLTVSGISTFSDDVKIPFDNKKLIVGADNDLELLHTGGNSVIKNTTSGSLLIHGNTIDLRPTTESGEVMLRGIRNAGVELRYDNTKRFEVTNTGGTIVGTIVADGADINGDIDVDGHTNLDNVSIAGVVTATTLKGAIEATSASFSSNIDANGDLDVDGHTNLDNVSIAGVTTIGNRAFITHDLTITGTAPRLILSDSDHNSDFRINVDGGVFQIEDTTNSNADRLTINSSGNVSIANDLDVSGDLDVDGHTNLDNVSVAGVVTATTFVGALTGNISGNATTANTAEEATNMNVSANNSTNETVYPVFVDGATGAQGAETDTGLTYNPSTGLLTAVKFSGDGSALTGISGSGGVTVQDEGSTLSTQASTLNFVGSGVVASGNGATKTITINAGTGDTTNVRTNTLTVSGVSTFTGNIDANGDLDVDGHLHVDNVSIAGFTTFSGPVSVVGVTTYENATHFEDTIFVVNLKKSTGNLTVSAPRTSFQNAEGTVGYSTFCPAGLNVSGIVTATSFVGNGSNLTGISANVGITTNLSGTFTASAGSPSTINTFGYGSGDLVVEYTIYIKNGSDFQSQKLLAMRDGTTIHSTQFAVMYSSSLLVQCDATISGSNILLRATPETGVSGSTTYKVKREVM